jgi:ATP phosphoribosyltransferase
VSDVVTIALPKGRVMKALAPLLVRAGFDAGGLLADGRSLVREVASHGLRFLLVKPDDVATYVEYGAADLGVCGRDMLMERSYDLYQPLDLGIGQCRMVVAGLIGKAAPPDLPRVGTKYVSSAAAHFARKGVQAEVIQLHGSVELAPVTGLADLIVDLVETGQTLAQNGLEVREEVARISSVLVANRAAFKLRQARLRPLLDALAKAAGAARLSQPPAPGQPLAAAVGDSGARGPAST